MHQIHDSRLQTSPAMPSPPPSPHVEPQSDTIPMLLPVLVLIFFLICFFSIFLLRDLLHFLSYSNTRRRGGGGGNEDGGARKEGEAGLDPAIISSFPTLPYASVRGIQEAECAVCLGEFDGGDVIRLLTVCCHAFHPPCIDSWLASHATCPMCRSDLHAPPGEAAVLAVREAVGEGGGAHSHVIAVDEDVVEEDEEPKSNSLRREGDDYTVRINVDEIT